MKLFICLTLACIGCATYHSIPVKIYKQTVMPVEQVEQTYRDAEQIFVKNTKCPVPTFGSLIIKDATIKELNVGRAVIYYDNGGLAIGVILGDFKEGSNILSFSIEHPDRQRTLFHELLHFFFHNSVGCAVYSQDVVVEHAMIHEMERIYFKQTNRPEVISMDWLYEVLRKEL